MFPLLTRNLASEHIAEKLSEKRVRRKWRLPDLNYLGRLNRNHSGRHGLRDPLVRPVLLLEPINIGAIERVTSGKCKVRRIECAAVIQIEHHGKHQA